MGWPVFRASLLAIVLLLPACTVEIGPGRTGEQPLLAPRRVTARVEREALLLVRLETEHGALLTTPEHPFATPRSGWVEAARLVPGDRVVSERDSPVRLLSVRSEPAPRPVPVFNLSVASSHAYFVGTDRLLVHNTRCTPNTPEAREEAIAQATREREELGRRITALTRTAPMSPEIAELKDRYQKLRMRINALRWTQRKNRGERALSNREKSLKIGETNHEAARGALEEARQRLAELESRVPSSEAERASFAKHRVSFKKQIAALTLSFERAKRILDLLRGLAELEGRTPATDADRRAIQERTLELRTNLVQEQGRARLLQHARRRRAAPEEREKRATYTRALRRRLFRTADHLADATRPRDPQERLEDELASRLQEAPSESRDARIRQLTDQIDTMKELVEVRREVQRLNLKRYRTQLTLTRQLEKGKDTSKLDESLAQVKLELTAVRARTAQLRDRERQLAKLGRPSGQDSPVSMTDTLEELERQLAESLESEQQLADLERALDATEGRTVNVQSSYERLQRELHEERTAVELALSALATEHAHIQTTQSGSSGGPTWQERLSAIQEEQRRVIAQWRGGLQARLDSVQGQLRLLRSAPWFHDEEIEADLTREIVLIERELQRFG